MNREDIIRMAQEAGEAEGMVEFVFHPVIERFAALVASAEREKSLRLWMMLDDVDTADDIAKADDTVYRSLCRQAHKKRFDVLTSDEVDAAIRARGDKND